MSTFKGTSYPDGTSYPKLKFKSWIYGLITPTFLFEIESGRSVMENLFVLELPIRSILWFSEKVTAYLFWSAPVQILHTPSFLPPDPNQALPLLADWRKITWGSPNCCASAQETREMGDKGEVSKTIMWVYSHKQVTISRYVDLQRFSGLGKTTELGRTRSERQDGRGSK